MKPVRYHDDARAELAAAVDYYAECDVDLAVRFHDDLRTLERLVARAPSAYPVFENAAGSPVRRALLEDFPFALLFVETADATWIGAVMHLRRAPGYWRVRI